LLLQLLIILELVRRTCELLFHGCCVEFGAAADDFADSFDLIQEAPVTVGRASGDGVTPMLFVVAALVAFDLARCSRSFCSRAELLLGEGMVE
jgi:hypothetical protein